MLTKRKYQIYIALLSVILVILAVAYLSVSIDLKYIDFALTLRTPKLITMIITAFCIGIASIAFQTVINNRIVTPCLLGMNSIYILISTAIALIIGVNSQFFLNKNLFFIVNVIIMTVVSVILYGVMFKVTNYNILYVLLSGTVVATLCTSISNSMLRVIDPNAYLTLQDSIIAGFDNMNSDIIGLAIFLIIVVSIGFFRDMKKLDVISLGRNQAINLGVNYDKTVNRIIIAVTIYIAIATAMVGPISFLGLIIANLSREVFKTFNNFYLMIGSFLLGGIILVFGQIIIEHVLSYSTVISVFINLFGGGYFLFLIIKNKGV